MKKRRRRWKRRKVGRGRGGGLKGGGGGEIGGRRGRGGDEERRGGQGGGRGERGRGGGGAGEERVGRGGWGGGAREERVGRGGGGRVLHLSLKRSEKALLLSVFSTSFLQCLVSALAVTLMLADASTCRHICTSFALRPPRLAWHSRILVTDCTLPPSFTCKHTPAAQHTCRTTWRSCGGGEEISHRGHCGQLSNSTS